MNQEEYEELIKRTLDPETTTEANNTLSEFLSDQQSIFFLFQMIESPPSEQIQTFSINFLGMYMNMNFNHLEPEIQEQLIDKLIELTFSEEYQDSELFYPILCDYINKDKSMALFPMIESCFSENRSVVIAMNVLSEIITDFDDEQGILLIRENQEKFLNYSLEGLQSGNWDLILPSMLVFFYTKQANPDLPNDPFIDIIIKNGEEPGLYQNDKYFGKYWPIISQSISKELIPSEKLSELYTYIIEFSSNEEIPYSMRIVPLYSLIGAVKYLDADQFSAVLNLVFQISMKCVEQDETIPIDYFDLIRKALVDLPMKDIYMMLKERITHLLSLNDKPSHVVSIVIYSIVFDIAPDAAFSDINSIIENLFSALEKNDDLLNTAVCIVLNSFQDSFRSVDVFAIHFLPQIVPFIISPNNELRQEAKNALHTICNLITVPVQGFFEALWQIESQIPKDEYDDYLEYLATAIEKSEDIGDQETESLKEFVLPRLSDLEDPNTASNYLSIFVTLVATNEELVEELLPHAINVINVCFTSADINNSSMLSCFYTITNFYETYGAKYNEIFSEVIKLAFGFLFSEDEEEDVNDTGDSLEIKSAALEACCTYAESTEDLQLAIKLQEKCVDFFTRKYDQEINNNGDDDEDDDTIEDIEYNAIKIGSNSSCLIAKLLNQEDARTLFQNIYEYIKETEYPQCASEALKPFTKFLHISGDEDKEFYLKYSHLLLNDVINGTLKAFHGKNIFNDQIDLFLMTNIAYLIAEYVKYSSSTVDELCEFMIQIIKSSMDSAYLYSFIGAYSDVIKYNTGSAESVQAILDLIPQLLENANDPDTKLNLAYLLLLFVQNDPQSIQSVQAFVPILQNWYEKGKESPNGNQIMLANIASALLTFMANGMEVDYNLLNEAVSEFPPFDEKETASMIQNMATIFSSNQLDIDCIANAALSLSKFFVLKDTELKKRKVPAELMDTAHQMFVTFSKSNPEIIQKILEQYQNTKAKFDKLKQILEEDE